MKEIHSLKNTIQEFFKETIDQLGLRKTEESTNSRGAVIKYSNDAFTIEFVFDRGIVEVGVAPLGTERSVGVAWMKSLLTLKELKNKVNEADRKLIIATRLGHNDQAEFLKANVKKIALALDKYNYKKTLKEINDLGHERFGY